MPFYDNPIFWLVVAIFIALLIIIFLVIAKRKDQQISGLFLVVKPSSQNKKTIRLMQLRLSQEKMLEAEKEKSNGNEKKWNDLWKGLDVSDNEIFDWQPIKNAKKYNFHEKDVVQIKPNGRKLIIDKILSVPFLPKLSELKTSF
jgi:hypothetical protein